MRKKPCEITLPLVHLGGSLRVENFGIRVSKYTIKDLLGLVACNPADEADRDTKCEVCEGVGKTYGFSPTNTIPCPRCAGTKGPKSEIVVKMVDAYNGAATEQGRDAANVNCMLAALEAAWTNIQDMAIDRGMFDHNSKVEELCKEVARLKDSVEKIAAERDAALKEAELSKDSREIAFKEVERLRKNQEDACREIFRLRIECRRRTAMADQALAIEHAFITSKGDSSEEVKKLRDEIIKSRSWECDMRVVGKACGQLDSESPLCAFWRYRDSFNAMAAELEKVSKDRNQLSKAASDDQSKQPDVTDEDVSLLLNTLTKFGSKPVYEAYKHALREVIKTKRHGHA